MFSVRSVQFSECSLLSFIQLYITANLTEHPVVAFPLGAAFAGDLDEALVQ